MGFLLPCEMTEAMWFSNVMDTKEEDTNINIIDENDLSLLQLMIINEKSAFSTMFVAAEVMMCVISSFIYAWLAAFSD
jgi:hypothetical protein